HAGTARTTPATLPLDRTRTGSRARSRPQVGSSDVSIPYHARDGRAPGIGDSAHAPARTRRVPEDDRPGRAWRPFRPAALARESSAESPCFRSLAGRSEESAGRPGDSEPALGRVFRPRHRADDRGLRLPGRTTDASGIARLAGGRVRPPRLVHQAVAPVDRDQRDLSPGFPRCAGAGGQGPAEQAPGPWPTAASRSRTGSRRRPESKRPAVAQAGRPECLPAAAAGHFLGTRLPRPPLDPQSSLAPLPPPPLPLH